MDIFSFPSRELKSREMVHALAGALHGEYAVEFREFDALINGNLEVDIFAIGERLVVRLAVAQHKTMCRRVAIDDWSVDLDTLRGAIRDLLKKAAEKGLLIEQSNPNLEGAPAHLLSEIFDSSDKVIEWFDEFCPEILSNPNLFRLRAAVNSLKSWARQAKLE